MSTDRTIQAARLRLGVLNCAACPVRAEARRPVPASGPPTSRIVLIGRNPGRDEDLYGYPFVGVSWQLLDEALRARGIDRAQLFVTNSLKCHTTGNRVPTALEYGVCASQHLGPEVLLVRPQIIVTFGVDAFVLVSGGVRPAFGARQFYQLSGIGALAAAFYHPSAVCRDQGKLNAWEADWSWLTSTPQWRAAYAGL